MKIEDYIISKWFNQGGRPIKIIDCASSIVEFKIYEQSFVGKYYQVSIYDRLNIIKPIFDRYNNMTIDFPIKEDFHLMYMTRDNIKYYYDEAYAQEDVDRFISKLEKLAVLL